VVDESKVAESDWQALVAYTGAQPDIAGMWLSWPGGPPGPESRERDAVFNLVFTQDLERHEREARARWGGPLCVSHLPRSRAELQRVQEAFFGARAEASDAGVDVLSVGPDEVANVVRAQVLIADDVAQRWVDERFGPGVIVLEGRLRPLD
jgi:hypothetical protein